MKKIWNKRKYINDYDYEQDEIPYTYNKNHYNKIKYSKNIDYCKNKTFKSKKYIKEYKNNDNYYPKYPNFIDCESFYPKNYVQTKNRDESINNKNYFEKNIPSEKNNCFFYYENSEKNDLDCQKNSLSLSQKEHSEEMNKISEDKNKKKIFDNAHNEKKRLKKFGVKSIPHPKKRKDYEDTYQKEKYIQQKKEEKNKIKNERKLSFSSSQTNESNKQSFSTQNTSCSSNKEKDVSYDNKKENDININQNSEINKNKFDECNSTNDINNELNPTNKYMENTEILKVQVKINKNETATFKIKRFDDLFLTISLFCEIYSIDEKLMKPIIMKVLSSLNTIYQIYNSDISKENIDTLKKIKLIDDNK